MVKEVPHLVANARLCRRRGYGKRKDANPDPGNGHADPRDEFDVDHQKSLPTLVLVSMKMRSVISSADKMPVPIGIGRRVTVSSSTSVGVALWVRLILACCPTSKTYFGNSRFGHTSIETATTTKEQKRAP